MARRTRERRLSSDMEESLVNLTPLIDVVFVVLIMFILVAPMLELDRVELADGKEARQNVVEAQQDGNIVSIHVHEDDTIWVNRVQVDIKQLRNLLIGLKKQSPDTSVRLFQDRQGRFGTYQSIKNAVEVAGFESLDVILKPV